ncbi:hypothetical protein AOQ84DRAFT_421518 [Glonium stellatum]|uniref:Uncharacterized protein n=1 Tax=Glonium stellatum TaxID=574774 RepID=A0A8E2F7T6_9PEZI|nr:hypothetical protein AOQ84DRAFT_421518 [Glonium stellatum]
MSRATNWLSTVSSVAAALVGMATLLTVYIAALQLSSQNRVYRLGLSWRSLGLWKSKVAKSALRLAFLVRKQWKPSIIFPPGFPKASNSDVEESDHVQAKASWVNFMQALALSPDNGALYEMQDAPELVNGIVPMQWTGKDLVGICSILGFQSHESKPSFTSPMPLPMQWSGPLGWMQFRSNSNGCVAEFRRKMHMFNQISENMHRYWQSYDMPHESYFLRSRLWNSINGFCLPDDGTLYLGGADKHERPQEAEDEPDLSQAQLLQHLTSSDLSEQDIMRTLFGKKENRPKALRREVERNGLAQAKRPPEKDMAKFLDAMLRNTMDSLNKIQVLRPCPGLLSVSVQGELAYSRGLRIEKCKEYDRKYTEPEDVDTLKHPHKLGNLYMDEGILALMKEALLLLKPDGFYFSPTCALYHDVWQAYKHIEEQSNKLMQIFPDSCNLQPPQNETCLYYAMNLCNELQKTRKTARAVFSVDDMRLLAKASCALKPIISSQQNDHGNDLVWAMLSCPELSSDLRKLLEATNLSEFLAAKAKSENGILDCTSLPGMDHAVNEKAGKYNILLVRDGEFTGTQILAALSDVFVTYFWIEKKWVTDVVAYNHTIPQSVTMC